MFKIHSFKFLCYAFFHLDLHQILNVVNVAKFNNVIYELGNGYMEVLYACV